MAEELAPPETPEDDTLDTAFSDAAQETPQPEAAAPEAAPNPLFERAKSAGLDLGDIDSSDKLADFLLNKYQEQQPWVQAGRQFATQPRVPEDDQPEPQADDDESDFDQGKYFAEKWPVPKWDDNFTRAIQAGWVQQDDSGKWVAAPGAEVMVAQLLNPLNQAHAAKQQAVQSLFQGNFYEQVYTALDKPLERRIAQEIQKALGQYQQTSKQEGFVQQFEKEHSAWLFEQKDGQRSFTAKGQQLYAAAQQCMKAGVGNPEQAISFALQMIGGPPKADAAPAAAPVKPAAPATPEQKSDEKKKSFLQKAVARAAHTPQSRGHTTSDEPQVVDQNELDSMFVQAGRQKSGV